MLQGDLAQVADQLFEVGAIKFGAFRLKLHETQPDAPLSPIYLNLRTPDNPKPGPLTPELLERLTRLLLDALHAHSVKFEYVAGIPNAGRPIADGLVGQMSPESQVPQLYLMKEETKAGRRIAGLEPGEWSAPGHVLLVDDLITLADTKLEAISTLEECGFDVGTLVVLVDREQGGSEWLEGKEWVRVIAVFTLSQLLNHYVETGVIDQQKADEVKAYVAASRA